MEGGQNKRQRRGPDLPNAVHGIGKPKSPLFITNANLMKSPQLGAQRQHPDQIGLCHSPLFKGDWVGLCFNCLQR
jgi:hypothetical protein